jgi:SAM-dependent methyltransferase
LKNQSSWSPSKFVISKGQLVPSKAVSINSYRMASYIALFYNEVIPKFASGNLLDLGCGKAPLFEFYKNKVNSVTTADWENCEHGINYIDHFCDINLALPFQDNSFETVVLSDVLEHLSNPEFTITEINRILKPNGFLLMNYPFHYGLHEIPFDYCRYTKFRIKSWINHNEMEIVYQTELGGLNDILEHAILRILKQLKGGRYLSFVIGGISKILRKSKLHGDPTDPYAYGFVAQKKNH